MRKNIKILAVASACLIIIAAASALRIAGRTEQATGPVTDLRIVSLGPYVTENIALLGLEDMIVGLTIHDLPERQEGKTSIGTLIDPSIETILSLRPDIVIASKEGNRPETVEQLNSLGINTFVLEELYDYSDISGNFIALAEKLGSTETARRILEQEQARLDAIYAGLEGNPFLEVLFLLGFRPLFTTGRTTFIGEMLSRAGGENIFRDIEKKWFSVNPEEVAKRDPEVIIYIEMEDGVEIFRERMPSVSAVKTGRIYGIEATMTASPTPRSFTDAVEQLSAILHP